MMDVYFDLKDVEVGDTLITKRATWIVMSDRTYWWKNYNKGKTVKWIVLADVPSLKGQVLMIYKARKPILKTIIKLTKKGLKWIR